jgi:hypothetical protein
VFAIACWILGGVAVLVAVAIVIGARRAYRHRGLESVGDGVSSRAELQDPDAAIGLQRNSTAGYPR